MGGRLCYKSFGTELNKNLTKVREGNKNYIGNILKVKHGSVIEHAYITFVILGCSRIFTHELVRHRAGVGLSQESMRFVRLDNIPFTDVGVFALNGFIDLAPYASPGGSAEDNTIWGQNMADRFRVAIHDVCTTAEKWITEFTEYIDTEGVPFKVKKQLTSLLRRLAPGGHATNIMLTVNHRALRHIIEMRTPEGAEAEIAVVFHNIAKLVQNKYPALYQDMSFNEKGEWVFENSKV